MPPSDANIAAVRAMPGLHDAVLVGLARREQGLLLPPGNPKQLHSLADVLASGAQMAVRQPGAGAQMLLDVLLTRAGAEPKDLRRLEPPCLTGPDLAAAIRAGQADCGIATRAAAKSAGLDFVPAALGEFRSADAAAQLFPPTDPGADRLPRRHQAEAARRGTHRLRPGARRSDPLRRLTLQVPLTRPPNNCKNVSRVSAIEPPAKQHGQYADVMGEA